MSLFGEKTQQILWPAMIRPSFRRQVLSNCFAIIPTPSLGCSRKHWYCIKWKDNSFCFGSKASEKVGKWISVGFIRLQWLRAQVARVLVGDDKPECRANGDMIAVFKNSQNSINAFFVALIEKTLFLVHFAAKQWREIDQIPFAFRCAFLIERHWSQCSAGNPRRLWRNRSQEIDRLLLLIDYCLIRNLPTNCASWQWNAFSWLNYHQFIGKCTAKVICRP